MTGSNPKAASSPLKQKKANALQEKGLRKMEAMLRHSAQGIHILFDNIEIAKAMKTVTDDRDFLDFNKMKKVQDVMTELIAKPTYWEKVDYLSSLETETREFLIRTYFNIVENTVKAATGHHH